MESEYSFGIFWMFLWVGIITWIAYDGLKTPYKEPIVFLIICIVLAWNFYMIWGQTPSLGLYKGKMFTSDSCVAGTVVSKRMNKPGGKIGYKIALHNPYVPESLKSSRWKRAFTELVSATQTIEVVGYPNQFEELPANECEAPEGGIRYHGRIDGGRIRDAYEKYRLRLERADRLLAEVHEISGNTELAMRNLAYLRSHELEDASEKLRKIADNVKRINVIAGRGGGQAQAFESIGD